MAKFRKRIDELTMPPANPSNGEFIAPQDAGDTTAATVDRERIAERAYELYIRRGGGGGRELDDWLAAERELMMSQERDRDHE